VKRAGLIVEKEVKRTSRQPTRQRWVTRWQNGGAARMELHTPKREQRPSADSSAESLDRSPSMCDTTFYPWNWGEEARNVNLSPGSSCSSPEYREQHVAGLDAGGGNAASRSAAGNGSESHRRGRPRADALTNLMKQGSTSPSSIKCTYCNRVFPREKSLQAHLRTHTGKGILSCADRVDHPRRLLFSFYSTSRFSTENKRESERERKRENDRARKR